MATLELNVPREYETFRVSVAQYRQFRAQGFVILKGLVPPEDVAEMNAFMDAMVSGDAMADAPLDLRGYGVLPTDRKDWVRAHMLHRISPVHERFLLHPRILDALAAFIGPDVLALQSMAFWKKPGDPGQGYHQDSYYIPSYPDTLCGAWLALTPATIENGCVWFAAGSQHDPVYPDPRGMGAALSANIGDLGTIDNASVTDESVNGLTRIVKANYADAAIAGEVEPGDVIFFGGHIIHWSYTNRSNIPRRAFVGHYCNARSFVPWNHGDPYEGDSANYLHILARGTTHLPYAQPRFGTPCAANQPRETATAAPASSMMGMDDGMMGEMPHATEMDPD